MSNSRHQYANEIIYKQISAIIYFVKIAVLTIIFSKFSLIDNIDGLITLKTITYSNAMIYFFITIIGKTVTRS